MNTEKKQLRVLVIDDHKVARDGLKMMLLSLRKFYDVIITEAETGEDGVRKLNHNDCNLVLVDYELPGISGAETVIRIRRFKPGIHILAMSHNHELAYIQSIQEAGANGYISKSIEPPEMLQAIRTVVAGKNYYSNEISIKLIQAKTESQLPTSVRGEQFTKREVQVLELLLNEHTNEEIAGRLFVSKRTIDTHRQNMIDKFHVKNTIGLIRIGFRQGILK